MILVNQLMDPAPFQGLRGVIFDCDGVLIDSFGANVFYYNLFRSRFGLPPMTREEEDYVHSNHVFDSIRRILPGELWEQALRFRKTVDYREVVPHLRLMDGVMELLSYLRAKAFRLGVNTSRTDTMDLVVSTMGLNGFFVPVITAVCVGLPKPHPEGIHRILSAWRLPPSAVAFVGDSTVDEGAARAAGVRFWSYGNSRLGSDLHIDDYFELLAVLRRVFGNTASGLDS